MTEKEANKILDELIMLKHFLQTEDTYNEQERDVNTVHMAINLIKNQQKALEQKDKEISELKEKYDKDTHTLQNQLDIANAYRVEKDKIIKLMAKYINSTDTDEDICRVVSDIKLCCMNENEDVCINCIIKFFQKKARKENEYRKMQKST